jgi:hypothetical protein
MYGDNYRTPDHCAFDWNGWGCAVEPVEEQEQQTMTLVDWRQGVESILETVLASPPVAETTK